jgi:beta-galactosidase
MEELSGLVYQPTADTAIEGPVFLRGSLTVEGAPKDTFLRLDGFTKGFVIVNGKNIGRYFNPAGPQKTLYVPAPFLREGENEIVVFESDATTTTTVEFFAEPDLG